ncbi:Retrovirus-related Pol polyprotein from transposon 17.6, partial [Mucuna pruriens]
MVPRGYARYRSGFLVPLFVHIPRSSSRQSKEKEVGKGEEESDQGRNNQAVASKIHLRSQVPQLAFQCGDGATYQRLMNRIFKEHIGNQLEVYVDDMVVKSKMEVGHADSSSSIFGVLRKHQLKLNLEKCSFGVKAGKFLGFMLTRRGIEANPEKCNTVIIMRSPRSVKEVQQLAGRIMTILRFLSRLVEKSAPIFQYLRKEKCFKWMNDYEASFQELKVMLATPPILTRSNRLVDPANLAKAKLGRQNDKMDGSSNKKGSGVGIILEGLGGVLIEQSIRFGFKASNNQAEYETLLIGEGVRDGKVDDKKRLLVGHKASQWRVSNKGPPTDSISRCGPREGRDFGKIHPTTFPSREKQKGGLAGKTGKHTKGRA